MKTGQDQVVEDDSGFQDDEVIYANLKIFKRNRCWKTFGFSETSQIFTYPNI